MYRIQTYPAAQRCVRMTLILIRRGPTSVRALARQLGVSPRTIRRYVSGIQAFRWHGPDYVTLRTGLR